MRNFSSDVIQKAAEEVKKSEHGDLMFRDPGHKRRKSTRRKHPKPPKSKHRITSRKKTSKRPATSTKNTSRKQNTSRRNTSRRQNTSRRKTSRRNTSRRRNNFQWGTPIPIRGRFCCNRSRRNNFR